MNITAITRFKHGEIYNLLKKLDWTQAELARRAEMRPADVGFVINLRRRPSRAVAEKIQNAFAEAGEYLDIMAEWPDLFEGLEKPLVLEQTKDIDIMSLAENPQVLQISASDDFKDLDFKEQLQYHISKLRSRDQELAKAFFIEELDDTQVSNNPERFGKISYENSNLKRHHLKGKLGRMIREELESDPLENRLMKLITPPSSDKKDS